MSAYLKGEEPKLVTSDHIDRMSTVSNIQDALAIIRGTDIGSFLEEFPIGTFDDLDEYLWRYFTQCIRHVESFKLLPKDMLKLSRTYIVKYDVSNIKAALQGISTGKKSRMIPVGIIHDNGFLDALSNAEDIGGIVELLIECKLGSYVPILEGYKVDGGIELKLAAEARLDGEYYKSMLHMAKSIADGYILLKAIGSMIDMTNLQITYRAVIEGVGPDVADCIISGGYLISEGTIRDLLSLKLPDIPRKLENTQYSDVAKEISSNYDRTKSITTVGETINKYGFRLLKEMLSPRMLSPLVMAWYLILKEVEIRNLRLILKAIIDEISIKEMKDYLVP